MPATDPLGYLAACHRADNRALNLDNLFHRDVRHRHFATAREVLVTGLQPALAVPDELGLETLKSVATYTREKQLVYAVLPVVGGVDRSVGGRRTLCAPLVYFPAELRREASSTALECDVGEPMVNVPLLVELLGGEPEPESVDAFAAAIPEPPWEEAQLSQILQALRDRAPGRRRGATLRLSHARRRAGGEASRPQDRAIVPSRRCDGARSDAEGGAGCPLRALVRGAPRASLRREPRASGLGRPGAGRGGPRSARGARGRSRGAQPGAGEGAPVCTPKPAHPPRRPSRDREVLHRDGDRGRSRRARRVGPHRLSQRSRTRRARGQARVDPRRHDPRDPRRIERGAQATEGGPAGAPERARGRAGGAHGCRRRPRAREGGELHPCRRAEPAAKPPPGAGVG